MICSTFFEFLKTVVQKEASYAWELVGQEHPGDVGLSENIKIFTCKSKYVIWVIHELPTLFTSSCLTLDENREHYYHLAKHHIFIIATEVGGVRSTDNNKQTRRWHWFESFVEIIRHSLENRDLKTSGGIGMEEVSGGAVLRDTAVNQLW